MSKQRNSRIPNTLEECTNTGTTVSNLYHYAQQLEKWGKGLLMILIVVGIVFTLVETVSLIDVNEELILPTLISSLLSWSIYAVLEFIAYHVLAMLIRALASITENTMITANVALWEASKKEVTVSEAEQQQDHASTLKDNEHNEITLERQSANTTQKPAAPKELVEIDNGSWTCPGCGQKNLSSRTSCWRCDYQI